MSSKQQTMNNCILTDEQKEAILSANCDSCIWEYTLSTRELVQNHNLAKKDGKRLVIPNYPETMKQLDQIHPDDIAHFERFCRDMNAGEPHIVYEFRVKQGNGEFMWLRYEGNVVLNEDDKPIKIVGHTQDINKERQGREKLEKEVARDQLTRVYKKSAADELIVGKMKENEGQSGALFLIDIDDFSSINDAYGKIYGDSILKMAASLIYTSFMVQDIVARVAADTFLVYCFDVERNRIERMAKKVMTRLREYVVLRDDRKLEVSIGVAMYPEDAPSYEILYSHADVALWYAKQQGKNQFSIYDKDKKYISYIGQTYRKMAEKERQELKNRNQITHVSRELFDFCFDTLINEQDLYRAIYKIFEEMCLHFNFDRSVLREYDTRERRIRVTSKWTREDDGDDTHIIEENAAENWESLVYDSKGQDYFFIDNGHAPFKDYTANFVKMNRIPVSAIVFPVWENHNIKFAVTFETWKERMFSEEEIETLSSVTKMLSNFILRLQTKAELEKEYMVGKTAMEVQKLVYYVTNAKTHEIYYLSPRAREIYKESSINKKCYEVMFQRKNPCEECPMKACNESVRENIVENYDSVEDSWYTLSATRMDSTGFEDDYLICKSDVTAFLQRVKGIDQVTGVMSYDKFRLEALKLLKKQDDHYALIFGGIQDFSRINDEYGYVTGDEVLKAYSSLIQSDMSEGELLCRIKGDDFVLMIRQRSLEIMGERLREYSDLLTGRLRKILPGISINCFAGIYEIPENEQYINRCIDKAMKARRMAQKSFYETKGVYFYSKEFEIQEHDKEELNRTLKDSLKKGGFRVFFQPKVDIITNKIIGAEALVRLLDKEGKMISPGRFIPLAEETGLIVEIDRFVYEETFSLMRKWMDEGIDVPIISVNLSRLHLLDDGLPAFMKKLSEEHGLRPDQIELEITESVFFEDKERLISMIKRLKEVGFVISMDDFGAGYSTLNFMKSLPVDIIKIDGGFFMKNEMDRKNKAVISAIMQLTTNLEFKTVSEGVETDEQVEFIKKQGGRYVQGYYFYKPMPAEEFRNLLKENK